MTTENKATDVNRNKVAKVVDRFTLVINNGKADGIKEGQRFLVYGYGEEIKDPETQTSLGRLEIVRGTGRVTHLQSSIATIKSDMTTPPSRTIRKFRQTPSYATMLLEALKSNIENVEEEILPGDPAPFEDPSVGDIARPV